MEGKIENVIDRKEASIRYNNIEIILIKGEKHEDTH